MCVILCEIFTKRLIEAVKNKAKNEPDWEADSFIQYLEFVHQVFVRTWFNKIFISKEKMENGFFEELKEKLCFLKKWSNDIF